MFTNFAVAQSYSQAIELAIRRWTEEKPTCLQIGPDWDTKRPRQRFWVTMEFFRLLGA